MWRSMAADWQTVSKRLYTPEGKREGGQAHSLNMLLHLFVLSMCVYVLIVVLDCYLYFCFIYLFVRVLRQCRLSYYGCR